MEMWKTFTEEEKDRIIQMAWEDRTSFESIQFQFGLSEAQVIDFMRSHSLKSSFKMWRKRMNGRVTKHHQKMGVGSPDRFKCNRQRSIANNKISKR